VVLAAAAELRVAVTLMDRAANMLTVEAQEVLEDLLAGVAEHL
jgi:hypothetical protein